MKKFLISLFGGASACAAIAAVILTFYLGSAIRSAADYMIPPITQTRFELKDVNVSLMTGKISLSGMTLGNPPGFDGEKSLAFERVAVEIDLYSLMTDKIHIKEISIEGLEVGYMQKLSGKSNVLQIGKNIDQFVNASKKGGEGSSNNTQQASKKVQIDHLILSGGKIRLQVADQTKMAVTTSLPVIEMRDIGKKESGVTAAEAMNITSKRVFSAIEAVVLTGPDVLNDGQGIGKEIEKAGAKVKESAKEAYDSVKKYFKKS